MSGVKRYIDINSDWRNRNLYPSVSDFVIEMNTLSAVTSQTSKDPVLLGFPYETNQLQGGSTFTQIAMSVEASGILNFYRNSWIEINGYFRKCIAYDPTTKVATVDIPFPAAYPVLTIYTVRYELPTLRDFTGGISPAQNQIVFNPGASSTDGYYVNQWVFLPGASPIGSYQWKRITAYNGTTKVATLAGKLNSIVPAGTVFEVLRWSYDNVKSFKYFGTEVGTNNPSCVSINLVNIILPNLNVANGYGGTLQNYPFLYVAIYSEKGETYQQTLISNTPASNQALFKVPVTYLQNNSFLTLGYSGMSPNVSFKTNDDLRIKVLLPSGEPIQFETGNPTQFPIGYPIPSDPVKQIQLMVEVTRL